MTNEERRKRPAHHVVHEYANLVSAGRIRLERVYQGVPLIPPVNSHVWHAFYTYCRSMREFFDYRGEKKKKQKYLRAWMFTLPDTKKFTFNHWTKTVQTHMEGHLMHVGGDRPTGECAWTGSDDAKYLIDFEQAWEHFLRHLKPEHKEVFRQEIDHRLDSEFRHCGTLGKEFIQG